MSDRNKETALWGWLKDHLKELRPLKHHIQRVENAVAKGVPDVEGCIEGDSFWLELKVAHQRANGNVKIMIEQAQVNWAIRRRRAGGRSWVLVRVCGPTWRDNRHYLIDGLDAEELQLTIAETRLAELSACQPKSAAVEVLKTLVGRP